MADLVAGDSRCFPGARAHRTPAGWVIRLEGPAEPVAVRETTADDAYRSLERAAGLTAPARSARALAEHVRRHPVARFLCQHGLPVWHAGANPCRAENGPDGVAVLDLRQVRTMMTGLRGLEELARHVTAGDRPAAPGQVEAALCWPILPAYLTKPVRAETDRDGELFGDRCRQIVATSLQVLQDTSGLRHETAFVTPHRLQPVLRVRSDLALYVRVFTERLCALG